jgi:hypothetical protein
MKTAMQELIERLEQYKYVKKFDNEFMEINVSMDLKDVLYLLKMQLPKEREQIICSYIANRYVNAGGYPTRRDEAEKYYNEFYN